MPLLTPPHFDATLRCYYSLPLRHAAATL